VLSKDDGKTHEVNDPKGSLIENLVFTTNGVVKLLKELNPQKASGPDVVYLPEY